ncbi:unnamed protein product [Euphydryas editha]|uniref:Tetraspanin n=1 Tax=Euphydryas editha TaxID=104508 RepID=A0AAU9UDM6_EUPED|nr:unnamed protein product [Euphydryas editha]
MHRRRGPNFTYVSGCVKYMIFVLNFIFWLFGGLLIGVGLYAFIDKWQATGLIKLDTVYDVILNISLLIALLGGVVFIVSFAGCIGALRENTCLLKFYSLCLLILFLVEMGGAVCGFVFPRSLHGLLELSFTERVVHAYRDDPDLQNFIDFAQRDQQGRILLTQGYYATQGAWFSDLAHSGKEPAYHLAYGVPLELRNGCRLIAFVSVVEVVVGFLKLIHALILALTGQTSIEKHFS